MPLGLTSLVGVLTSLVPLILAMSGALDIQVLGAGAGAAALTAGFGLAGAGWRRRRQSELHRLAVATGFFLGCVGAFGMLAAVGLYH
jgi:hypothetical protein